MEQWEILAEERVFQYHYPPDDLVPQLVDNFFVSINNFFPVLHRPSFERALADRRHHSDIGFGSVVMLVCAIGARHSDDMRCREQCGDIHSSGWKWFDQVQVHRKSFLSPPRLYDLQIFAVCCFSLDFVERYLSTSFEAIGDILARILLAPVVMDDGWHWYSTRSGCRRASS